MVEEEGWGGVVGDGGEGTHGEEGATADVGAVWIVV